MCGTHTVVMICDEWVFRKEIMNKIQIQVSVLGLQEAGLIGAVLWQCGEFVARRDFAKPQTAPQWQVKAVRLAYEDERSGYTVVHGTGGRMEDVSLQYFPRDHDLVALGNTGWKVGTSPTSEQWNAFLEKRFGTASLACIQLAKVDVESIFLCGL